MKVVKFKSYIGNYRVAKAQPGTGVKVCWILIVVIGIERDSSANDAKTRRFVARLLRAWRGAAAARPRSTSSGTWRRVTTAAEIADLIRKQEARIRRQKSKAAIARAKEASKSRNAPMTRPVDTYITSSYGMRLHPIFLHRAFTTE